MLPSELSGLHAGDALPSEVELSLIPYAKLRTLTDPEKFCKQATGAETASTFGSKIFVIMKNKHEREEDKHKI